MMPLKILLKPADIILINASERICDSVNVINLTGSGALIQAPELAWHTTGLFISNLKWSAQGSRFNACPGATECEYETAFTAYDYMASITASCYARSGPGVIIVWYPARLCKI